MSIEREARFCIWQRRRQSVGPGRRLQTRRVTHYFASAPTVHAHSMLRTLVGRAERDSKRLTILHFNDVYDVSADRAAKFVTVIRSYAEAEPLILFSGDCYSPSIMSVVSKGSQMPPVLNAIGVQAAVFGNHEFDWGLPRAEELCAQCTFPWLMSNCWVRETGRTLGGGERTVLLEHAGVKVGLMGLIEREWLASLSTIEESELECSDFVAVGKELAADLRKRGAEVIIALTHMRQGNDERLMTECADEIDLILGGHDHHFEHITPKERRCQSVEERHRL